MRDENGDAVLLGAYPTWAEQNDARKAALVAGYDRVAVRPADEDSTQVTAMFRAHDYATLTGKERRGDGPNPRRTSDWLTYHDALDDEARQAHELLGVEAPWSKDEWEGTGPWSTMGRTETLAPDVPLHTAQEWISGTHLAALTAKLEGSTGEYVTEGGDDQPFTLPNVYRHSDGSMWVLDGNHTIVAAREAGRPVRVVTLNHAALTEVRSWAADDDDAWGDEND